MDLEAKPVYIVHFIIIIPQLHFYF
jgi:hypothetical protein